MNVIYLQQAGWFGTPEIILIVLAIILLFGGKKIPELMRGLGKGVKEFKDGVSDPEKENSEKKKESDESKDDSKKE
ncbi:MAG: twin-arginine translocase TatA/TatE family subunit [Bacteroidales bacterium]|nr:twin-arginine translocase TatA/TatE family subunit [Bacteroidales bacterium]